MSDLFGQKATAAKSSLQAERFYERAVRRLYKGVYNYLVWMTRDAALAEDLTQEAFMRLWQHPPRTRKDQVLKAWLYQVARNQYFQYRRRLRIGEDELEDADEMPGDGHNPDANPEIYLERRTLSDALLCALAKLPPEYREVIILHTQEDLTLREIAQILEIPIGTVKSRRARSYTMLRCLLERQGLHPDEM